MANGFEQGRLQLQLPAAYIDDLDGKDGMPLGVDAIQRIAACGNQLDGSTIGGLQVGEQPTLGNTDEAHATDRRAFPIRAVAAADREQRHQTAEHIGLDLGQGIGRVVIDIAVIGIIGGIAILVAHRLIQRDLEQTCSVSQRIHAKRRHIVLDIDHEQTAKAFGEQ